MRLNINTKSFKRYQQIEFITSCFPNAQSIDISTQEHHDLYKKSKYDVDYSYAVFIRPQYKYSNNIGLWGYVGYNYSKDDTNYKIINICDNKGNINNTIAEQLLITSMDILNNIDTVLNNGITITPKIGKEWDDTTWLDFRIERNVLKSEYDWASQYWEYEDED